MEYWLLTVLVSVIATLIGRAIWKHELELAEMSGSVVMASIITAIMIFASVHRDYADIQILNGQVISKYRDTVHCRHSYKCRCYTTCSGSGSNRTCTEHCSTCYDHNEDYDWVVKNTFGTIDIDTIDRQGKKEPPRWTIVKVGEPYTKVSTYTNYIKGSPDSLFNHMLEKSGKYNIPTYPSNIYDYYRYNRIVSVGVNVPNSKELNDLLNTTLIKLSPQKKVNIIPVFTNYDVNFARALESKWLGGKRNDVVVVMGLNGDKIEWVKVFSWSVRSIVNYELESNLKSLDKFDYIKYTAVVGDAITKHYIQRSPEEFKYLDDAIKPSDWIVYTSLILSFFGSLLLARFFSKN